MKKAIFLFVFLTLITLLLLMGRQEINTEITIKSSPTEVWKVFTDTSSYKEWNPFIISITGDLEVGNTIEVTFKEADGGTITFTPKIIQFEEDRLLQWRGKLLIPGIFTGVHTFKLEALEKNNTRLIQEESFSGILVPFFNFDKTEKSFNELNQALKERTEKRNN